MMTMLLKHLKICNIKFIKIQNYYNKIKEERT